jgi:uncharacterized membrane protein SirB2
MFKSIHIFLVLFSLFSFVSRVILSEIRPAVLQKKWLKIAPHVLDTLLIMSGIILVIKGQWFSAQHNWLIGKLVVLVFYVGFGILTMHSLGKKRWLAFTAAIGCFAYIMVVAISKNPLFFM